MIIKDNFHNFKEISSVVATVTVPDDLVFLEQNGAPTGVDFVEFRLDNLRPHLDRAEAVAAQLEGKLLITARHPDEGGVVDLAEDERQQLLARFLPKATLVDIELRSLEESPGLRDLAFEARIAGVAVVASMHDFERMPPLDTLRAAATRAVEIGVDIVKFAVVVERMSDVFGLVDLIESTAVPVSAMGMGPLGKISRLVLARAGSVLNYGYLRVPNAPGQWSAGDLRRLIDEIA